MSTWAHLHLPRLQSGTTEDVISVKVPGQKIGYVSRVHLTDVTFKVSEPGRQRCIKQGVRNVHAWVIGEDSGSVPLERPEGWRKALYDPWKGGAFVDSETFAPVHTAGQAILSGKNVYYKEG